MPQVLLRLFRLNDASPAERRATIWIALMFFCSLASTFVLRPLRSQFGVDRGVLQLPYLYSLTLLATALCVLPFWWLANRMPSRRFIPLVQHVCAVSFVVLAIGLAAIGEYQWDEVPWFGEFFWGGFNAINVVVPTMVWIHTVEHFKREQARRLFALIAVGGTLGAVIGSWVAGWLAEGTAPWVSGIASALLLEVAFLCFRGSLPHCRQLTAQEATEPRVAAGGIFAGLRLLVKDGYVRAIGTYMVLLGMLSTAFYAAQTELIGDQISAAREQHGILASVEFWSQSLVLGLQLFFTGRLLRRFPPTLFLVSLPIVSIIGLGALWLWPVVLSISLVQVFRRGAQYAFEKPAREVLYTPLELETKHKVKFLFDTFVFRLGDLFGAVLQVQLRQFDLGTGGVVVATTAVALVWIGLGAFLGRWRQRPSSS